MFRCLRIVQIGRSPLPLVVHLHRSPFFSVPSSLLLRLHSHHSRQASLPGFTNEFVHPLFLIFFHFYPFPAYFIRCHPFHPVISIASTAIHFHPTHALLFIFIQCFPHFQPSSIVIHIYPLSCSSCSSWSSLSTCQSHIIFSGYCYSFMYPRMKNTTLTPFNFPLLVLITCALASSEST